MKHNPEIHFPHCPFEGHRECCGKTERDCECPVGRLEDEIHQLKKEKDMASVPQASMVTITADTRDLSISIQKMTITLQKVKIEALEKALEDAAAQIEAAIQSPGRTAPRWTRSRRWKGRGEGESSGRFAGAKAEGGSFAGVEREN